MPMYKQVDPLPIWEHVYYHLERLQIVDNYQSDRTFGRQYVIASLVAGETQRTFRNELLLRPTIPPSNPNLRNDDE